MLTKRQVAILQKMAEAFTAGHFDEAELVQEGIFVYRGIARIGIKTLHAFIDHGVVSLSAFPDSKIKRYMVNELGRFVARKPEMSDKVWLQFRSGRPFTILYDEIVEL